MYVVIVVVFSGELEDLVMHSIMTYNYESSMDASKSMKYVKVLRETIIRIIRYISFNCGKSIVGIKEDNNWHRN